MNIVISRATNKINTKDVATKEQGEKEYYKKYSVNPTKDRKGEQQRTNGKNRKHEQNARLKSSDIGHYI